MQKMAVKGRLDEGMKSIMKAVFIAGMSAALGFDGDDLALAEALKPALHAISQRHGGTIIEVKEARQ